MQKLPKNRDKNSGRNATRSTLSRLSAHLIGRFLRGKIGKFEKKKFARFFPNCFQSLKSERSERRRQRVCFIKIVCITHAKFHDRRGWRSGGDRQ